MELFNEKAAQALAGAQEYDATYCAKMAKRLKAMGIGVEAASSAVCTMIEKDAVPEVGIWAATPSVFKSLLGKKVPHHAKALEAGMEFATASSLAQ